MAGELFLRRCYSTRGAGGSHDSHPELGLLLRVGHGLLRMWLLSLFFILLHLRCLRLFLHIFLLLWHFSLLDCSWLTQFVSPLLARWQHFCCALCSFQLS